MVKWIAEIAVFILAAACYTVQAWHFTHMLQLNSYRDERYNRWCGENGAVLASWKRLLPALVPILSFLSISDEVLYVASAVILLAATLLNLPRRAKKPLVVTARVKRLFAAEAAVLLLLLALSRLFDPRRMLLWVGFAVCIVWFWVRVAAWLTAPIEKRIAAWFVEDARRILKSMPQLKVIGITGSYGKTSTKVFLHALLSTKYNVLMTPENFNTTLGVVRTVREHLRPSHQIFLAEMGAKNVGDIQEICDLVHPTVGVITSIGEQHLETFGSVENIIRTKFELADALPADGVVFLNTDNEYIRAKEVSVPWVSYGLEQADYTARITGVDAQGTHFTVTAPDEEAAFVTKLLGAHNIQNLAGCIAVAHKMGIPLGELQYPVRLLKPVPHRLQLLPNGYIDDAYNSNPAGFRSALDVLGGFQSQRVLVTPGMVELGERQEVLNRELGAYAAKKCDYAVLVGVKQAPPLKEGLLSAGFDESRIYVAPTLNDAIAHLAALPAPNGRIVLLENDLPDNF